MIIHQRLWLNYQGLKVPWKKSGKKSKRNSTLKELRKVAESESTSIQSIIWERKKWKKRVCKKSVLEYVWKNMKKNTEKINIKSCL